MRRLVDALGAVTKGGPLETALLIETIETRKALEAEIEAISAPFKAALAAALGDRPEVLREVKALEESERAALRERYLEAAELRRARLLAGEEAPPIALDGFTVRWDKEIRIVGDVPPAFLVPDMKAIKAAATAPGAVPGAVPGVEVSAVPVFVRAK